MHPSITRRAAVFAAALACAAAAGAQQGQTIKIAWIDPMSGAAATAVGQLKAAQLLAEEFNRKGTSGVRFEVLAFDSKLSPPEAVAALRSAIDQGVQYVLHGVGSGVSLALIEALERHNARNKGKEVIYFNHGAIDPELTNEKCSYWHFRVDAHGGMKVATVTTYLKDLPEAKKIYLFNQNYAHGQQVSQAARQMLKEKRPDMAIVGDDLVPLLQVRDFSPYVAKIRQSGADSVMTGNWGTDFSLFVRALQDAGLHQVKLYTYYGHEVGNPTVLASSPDVKAYSISYAHHNMGEPIASILREFKQRTGEDFTQTSLYNSFALLDAAFAQTGSTDPVKVAAALEGMRINSFNGAIHMRKEDHQLQQGMYVTQWQKAGGQYTYDSENTGYTFVPIKYIAPEQASTPTTCQMKRPS